MQFGDQIPTGTYLDMTANLPVVHPEKVLAPVLLVRGEYDGIATVADLEEFYNKLPNGDRQFIILPGTAHSVALAINRQLFWHVTRAFLDHADPDRDVTGRVIPGAWGVAAEFVVAGYPGHPRLLLR